MTTRHNMRPRAVNLENKLMIVRDVSELDPMAAVGLATDGAAGADGSGLPTGERPAEGPAGGDWPTEEAPAAAAGSDGAAGGAVTGGHGHKAPHKPPADILTPACHAVPSYTLDYAGGFVQPVGYLRSTEGFVGSSYVEYDLDTEDEEWLERYNAGGQQRLSADLCELVLHRLERAWQAATEKLAAAAAEKGLPMSTEERATLTGANTAALPRDAALAALRGLPLREAVLGSVYEYWAKKRALRGKPLLRRLQQAPTAGDPNPFTVFRQREGKTRPQTRRRRENDEASLQRMQDLRDSMEAGRAVLQLLAERELRKLELVTCEREMQLRLLTERFGAREPAGGRAASAAAAGSGGGGGGSSLFGGPPPGAPGAGVSLSAGDRLNAAGILAGGLEGLLGGDHAPPCSLCAQRHRGDCDLGDLQARAATLFVPPPPEPPLASDLLLGPLGEGLLEAAEAAAAKRAEEEEPGAAPPKLRRGAGGARLGRGGRLIFERAPAGAALVPPPK